jgi:uncharacterized cupin superfamily protein
MADRPVVNIADVALTENLHGERFLARLGRIGAAIGLTGLGCTLHVVLPGKRAYRLASAPFPSTPTTSPTSSSSFFRARASTASGPRPLRCGPGDLLGAPAGKRAHQLVNTGTEDLRYLAISSKSTVDVVEYPDSGKFAVAAGVRNGDFRTASFAHIARSGGSLDYWEGES